MELNIRSIEIVTLVAVTALKQLESVFSAHYDSRFASLLLIQQSRVALKPVTVFGVDSLIWQRIP